MIALPSTLRDDVALLQAEVGSPRVPGVVLATTAPEVDGDAELVEGRLIEVAHRFGRHAEERGAVTLPLPFWMSVRSGLITSIGDREADVLRVTDDRGVDADDLTGGVHERSARVARVDRGVGLDQVAERLAAT